MGFQLHFLDPFAWTGNQGNREVRGIVWDLRLELEILQRKRTRQPLLGLTRILPFGAFRRGKKLRLRSSWNLLGRGKAWTSVSLRSGLTRLRCKALSDGAVGWATAQGPDFRGSARLPGCNPPPGGGSMCGRMCVLVFSPGFCCRETVVDGCEMRTPAERCEIQKTQHNRKPWSNETVGRPSTEREPIAANL